MDADELVKSKPLACTALAEHDIRYAATQILSLKGRRKSCDDPGRTAALLMVLYCEERLEQNRQEILGMSAHKLYSLLCNLEQECFISHPDFDLVAAVAEVDTVGTTTRIAQSLCASSPHGVASLHETSASQLAHVHRQLDAYASGSHDDHLETPGAESDARDRDVACGWAPGDGMEYSTSEYSSFYAWYGRKVSPLQILWVAVITVCFLRVMADDLVQSALLLAAGVSCLVVAAIVWRQHRGGSWGPFGDLSGRLGTNSVSLYMLLVILYNLTLPSADVALLARTRIARNPLEASFAYFLLGVMLALQATMDGTRSSRYRIGRLLGLLAVRTVQLCLSDEKPVELLLLCCKIGIVITITRRASKPIVQAPPLA